MWDRVGGREEGGRGGGGYQVPARASRSGLAAIVRIVIACVECRMRKTHQCHTHRGQRPIFTLTANSGSLYKIENSCTARIFSMHNFQTILNANATCLPASTPCTAFPPQRHHQPSVSSYRTRTVLCRSTISFSRRPMRTPASTSLLVWGLSPFARRVRCGRAFAR